jgi:hypothetical protein
VSRTRRRSPEVSSPLRIANRSPPSGWVKDFHLQAVKHARHTRNGPSLTGKPGPCPSVGR